MPLTTIETIRSDDVAGLTYCRALETGKILLFPRAPFELPAGDRAFLLTQRQAGTGYHKNIAYRPQRDRVTGFVRQAAPNWPDSNCVRASSYVSRDLHQSSGACSACSS